MRASARARSCACASMILVSSQELVGGGEWGGGRGEVGGWVGRGGKSWWKGAYSD